MEAIGTAAALGALIGGRTFAVPALLARGLERHEATGRLGPVSEILGSGAVATALTGLAAAELVADKLPVVGPRIEPAGALARSLAGAVTGAAVAEILGRGHALPALVGAAAALAGAHAGYHLRRKIRRKADVADPVVALAEDAVVIGLGSELIDDLLEPVG
ncbi:MAG: DUF4126 family protein [Gemmatimonadota bacterium]